MTGNKKTPHIRYFTGQQLIWFSAFSIMLTVIFHLAFPGHRVDYAGSIITPSAVLAITTPARRSCSVVCLTSVMSVEMPSTV